MKDKIVVVTIGLIGMLLIVVLVALLFLSYYPSVGQLPSSKIQSVYQEHTDMFYDDIFHNFTDFSLFSGEKSDIDRNSVV